MSNVPKWLPDWRDASAYPAGCSVSPEHWAWEFLRRNPQYQEDYAWYAAQPPAMEKGSPEDIRQKEIRRVHGVGKMVDPATEFDSSVADRLRLHGIGGPLYGPYNPRAAPVTITANRPGDVVMLFNVSLPIAPQIERARHILSRFQELNQQQDFVELQSKRNRPDKFPTYLRVLDADAVGARTREIARTLFPEAKNRDGDPQGDHKVRDARQAAVKLRDSDYRWLVFQVPEKK